MKLYLVQHGRARPKGEDPERLLSPEGEAEVRRLAVHLSTRLENPPARILHSCKNRSRATAEILAESLQPAKGIEQTDGLKPVAEASLWKERLGHHNSDLMLVGHLPHLGNLATLLLRGDGGSPAINFTWGCVVLLNRDEEGVWSVDWMLTPALI